MPSAIPNAYLTASSSTLAERLQRVLPGGDTRTGTFYAPFPAAMRHGSGCRMWDVDGNAYIDMLNNFTSLVHGHAHPRIVEAIVEQAALGTAFPAPTEGQAELAERICRRVDSIERVRFANSGTEAVMHAIRLARVATGRSEIVKAELGYHGSWEQVPMSQHPGGRTTAAELPGPVRELVHFVDFNDVDQLEQTMAACGGRVAAILLEPVLGASAVPLSPAFAAAVRRLADEHGALVIADEVVTLRLSPGAFQERLPLKPDVTTLGKLIGGGLPVGAFGAGEALMALFDPRAEGHLHHSGTFNGNALTIAAGVASLDLLDAAQIERINGLGERFAADLERVLLHEGIDATVTACGSLLHLEVRSAAADGGSGLAALHAAALRAGVFFAPRGSLNLSTAMTEEDVAEALAAFGRAAADIGQAVEAA
jgi:glutamate-1-semialdehyde 2,1-aminomutase